MSKLQRDPTFVQRGKIASRCGLPGFPRTVMTARNVDDLLASFFSCSRLRTPERDGCFIRRTVTMIADENRKPAHRYRPIIEPLRFLLRLPTPGEAVVKALRLAGGVGKGRPAPQKHITHRLKISSAASTPSRLRRRTVYGDAESFRPSV